MLTKLMPCLGFAVAGVTLLVAGPAQGQGSPAADSVHLTLRLGGGESQFRPGETIPIELEFASEVPRRFVVDTATYDRSGRLTIDQYHIEPNELVTDPLLDYLASSRGFVGGGVFGMPVLDGNS